MAVAIADDSIWVLGAFQYPISAEVRQYSRKTHQLTASYMKNLCKTDQTDQMKWPTQTKEVQTPSPYGNWCNGGKGLAPLYLGGSLAVDKDAQTGATIFIYGLAACGTMFRINPKTGHQEVLGMPPQYHVVCSGKPATNLFTGITLQKFKVPTKKEPETRIIVAYLHQNVQYRGRTLGDRWKLGIGKQLTDVYVLDLDELLSEPCRPKYNPGKKTWTIHKEACYGGHGASGFLRNKKPVVKALNFRKIAYADGHVYWYDGTSNKLRRVDIRVRVPCDQVLGHPKIKTMITKRWSKVGEPHPRTNGEAIESSPWINIRLKEGRKLMPWQVKVMVKTTKSGSAVLKKYLVCTKPRPPSNRPSGQQCCVLKSASNNDKCATRALELL